MNQEENTAPPAVAMILTILVVAIGCEQTTEQVASPEPRVSLTVTNLKTLPPGEGHYTLWAGFFEFAKAGGAAGTDDEELVSLGDFNIGADGVPVAPDGGPVRFRIPGDKDVQLIEGVVVTIGSEALSKSTHDEPGSPIMGGVMQGDEKLGRADLSTKFHDAVGADFSAAEGQYALLAPSSPVRADSSSGVWFVDISTSISAGLKGLPVLEGQWIYEGWVVDERSLTPTYYSTGTFRRADSADTDGAGPGKGPDSGLVFPGQDFITGPLARPDLSSPGFTFMITIEPVPDNAPGPFSFDLLDSRRPPLLAGA
ncbi:MAG: hypothetical protein OEM41_05390, partial [Ignavibacteria bacterium]|nr:hypothetical protein [Ignavibacteria bacterium]